MIINKIRQVLIWLVVFVFLSISVINCSNDQNLSEDKIKQSESTNTEDSFIYKDISVGDAKKLIENNLENDDFVILDVRTEEEFNEGHIKGAIMIDFYADDFRDQLDALDKNKKYLVYCRTANRSGQAMNIMSELGFKEAYNLLGGIVEWEKMDSPIVNK